MSTRRVPAFLLLLALTVLVAPPARAQDEGSVSLTLLQQTPWTSPEEPQVQIRVVARNGGAEPLEDPSLHATLFSPVLSRSAFEGSLRADPEATILAEPVEPLEEPLGPGATRPATLTFDMRTAGVSPSQSYVYPLRIDLLSGSTPVATLRSAITHIVKPPLYPVSLSSRVVLHYPLTLGLDGVFRDPGLERAIAPGGWIGAAVAALRGSLASRQPVSVDLVLSPVLLYQLEGMVTGYRVAVGEEIRDVPEGQGGSAAASRVLSELRAIAGDERVETSVWPFGAPTIPSLLGSLSRDLDAQFVRGRAAAARIVGSRPPLAVTYPRASAVTQESLDLLAARDANVLLLDPDAVPPEPRDQGFAPPAVARLPVTQAPGDGGEPLAAVVPDPSVQALFTSETTAGNPVLAAQQVFSELATIWLEQPGLPPGRALALAVPLDPTPPPQLIPALMRRIAGAPFLHPTTAPKLVASFPPPEGPTTVVELNTSTFSSSYADAIKESRRRIDTYASMLVRDSTEPEELRTRLLFTEGAEYLENEPAGVAEISAVDERVNTFLGKVRPVEGPPITLTSRTGTIPVQVTNDTGVPVRAVVELVSPHLTGGGKSRREVELPGGEQTLRFEVALTTTGQFPVQVVVRAPTGRPLSETTVAVRSTAYNLVALVITIGAALVLVALWARRFVPRRTS